ncbi:hypothetical protein L0666_14470 [Octadecabacter sp. CECT 8868]|nr:hypothetical protein [Octadecabacter algicola]
MIPVLPLPAAAVPAAAAPANAMQVGWAALFARANHRATPALIQKWLRVDATQADAVMRELVRQNVVHAPVAGSAAAIKPMYASNGPNTLFGKRNKVVEATKDVIKDLMRDDDVAQANDADDVTAETAAQEEPRSQETPNAEA